MRYQDKESRDNQEKIKRCTSNVDIFLCIMQKSFDFFFKDFRLQNICHR